jgi:hypothetical protein
MARKPIDHLDAAVAAVVGEGNERQKKRKMTAKERYDAERVKASYDCPRWLREAVKQAASERGTSASQFATFLLSWALAELERGNEELRDLLWRSREARPDALRIEYDIEIPDSLHRVISTNGTD